MVTMIDNPILASQAPKTRRIRHINGSFVIGVLKKIDIRKTKSKIIASSDNNDIINDF